MVFNFVCQMETRPYPVNEVERLAALQFLQILDTSAEQDFDDIAELASQVCDAPFSLITLVDEHRQWFKAKRGIGIAETARDISFCAHAIHSEDIMIVPDMNKDERFFDNPFVTGAPDIRFYAGVPLITEEGYALGTLCVLDQKPRTISTEQVFALRILAKQVLTLFKMRLEISDSASQLEAYFNSTTDSVCLIGADHRLIAFNKVSQDIAKNTFGKHLKKGSSVLDFIHPSILDSYKHHFSRALAGEEIKLEKLIPYPGFSNWISITYLPVKNLVGKIVGVAFSAANIHERKSAELALQQSQQMFSDMARNVPGVIYQIVVKQDGSVQLTYMSERLTEFFGISVSLDDKDPVGTIAQHIPEEDRGRFVQSVTEAVTQQSPWEFEGRIVTPAGEVKWLQVKSLPIVLNGELVFNGIAVDITSRKIAEDAILKEKQLSDSLINSLPGVFYLFDKDGKFLRWNKNFEEITEYTAEEISTIKPLEFFPEEERPLRQQRINKVFTEGESASQSEFLTKSGKRIPYYFSAKYVQFEDRECLMGTGFDISDRIKAEKALKQSEQTLRDIFNFSPVPALICRISDGLVIMVNESLEKAAGANSAALIGKRTTDFYENLSDRDTLMQELTINGRVNNLELPIRRPDGYVAQCLVSCEVIMLNNERMLLTAFIDISERKKAEVELNKSYGLVTEQNKRLLNFSYIVSHNLRSHASNIKSIIRLLQEATSEEERTDLLQYLKTVSGSLDDTLYNLNEVVSIHKDSNLVYDLLSLNDYIGRATEVLREQILAKNAVIKNNISDDITIRYNPAYLDSILLNFISNAIKYSHPGRQPVVELDYCKQEGQDYLQVKDNGIGIDLEKHGDKLFGMYKTFHGNTDARGIGLFISKSQIEFMGGKVEVESELGTGTTFKIYF